MALTHDVALFTGTAGMRLDTWDRYDVVQDMLQAGSPWAFSLYKSSAAQSAWEELRAGLVLGDLLSFSIDGAVQMNGRLEQIRQRVSRAEGSGLAISGRDLAGLALSWDADPTVRLKGLPLGECLAALFRPLGILPQIGAGVDDAREVQNGTRRGARASTAAHPRHVVDYAHPRPGEKVWQVAEAICRRLGYLLWVAPSEGRTLAVIVGTPAYNDPPRYALRRVFDGAGNVTDDSNILDSDHDVNLRDVPTDVTVYTGSARGDAVSARSAAALANGFLLDPANTGGYALDALVQQPRHVHAQRARDLAGGQREAQRILADANAKLRTYTCTAQGHGQVIEGETLLYAVNSMATVQDDETRIREDMLITRVQFSGSRSGSDGTRTHLTLSPKGAIFLTPETT